jgi:hypothetical protein
MYGLGDDLAAYAEDEKFLKGVIKRLLKYAPTDVRETTIELLKAKNLLPEGVSE